MIRLSRLTFIPLIFSAQVLAAGETISLQAAQLKALGIATLAAGGNDAARSGTLPARVLVPNAQMRVIAAPVGGMIEMLAVAPGVSVKRGQVLAHLASPQALELQREALQSASQSGLLQQSLKRDEQLFAEGLIAESRLQATRAAAAQASALVAERRQGVALAGVAAGKLGGPLILTAPIDGVVLEQGVQLGQRVEAASLVYRIAKLSPLWLEIQAPVDFAATLREGMAVTLPAIGVTGKLIAIGRTVDAASQTVILRAEVAQGADRLRPGQVVEVGIAGATGEGAAAGQRLPAGALVRHEGKTLVFVQTASNEQGTSFVVRPVQVIGQGGDSVVVDTVKAGEKVAVKGVSGLKAMLAGVGKE